MNRVMNYYEKIDEDSRFSRNSRRIEFLTTTHVLDNLMPQRATILDVGAGTGPYSFYYAEKGCEVTAVDLTPKHIDIIRDKRERSGVPLEACVGNATDLNRFETGRFDVVLCLGPMYHLTDAADRERCVKECLRVLKKGGYLAIAYISKFSILPMLATRNPTFIRDGVIRKVLDDGVVVEGDEDCFWTDAYFPGPEEIEAFIGQFATEVVDHLGTDGLSHTLHEYVDKLDADEFEAWLHYHYRTCREPSIRGSSAHGLLVCRKIGESA